MAVIVNGTTEPGVNGPGGAVFVTDRSAAGSTPAVDPAVLSDRSGSGVDDDWTLAMFVIVLAVDDGDVATTTVTVAVAPLAMFPSPHVTTPAAAVQAPDAVVAETKDVPSGNVSVSVTASAVFGPVLVATSVEVRFWPGSERVGARGLRQPQIRAR